jgi:hypothetical protein
VVNGGARTECVLRRAAAGEVLGTWPLAGAGGDGARPSARETARGRRRGRQRAAVGRGRRAASATAGADLGGGRGLGRDGGKQERQRSFFFAWLYLVFPNMRQCRWDPVPARKTTESR